jgi:hypothetical protein
LALTEKNIQTAFRSEGGRGGGSGRGRARIQSGRGAIRCREKRNQCIEVEARAGVKDSEEVLSAAVTALSLSGAEDPLSSARSEGTRTLRSRNRTLPQFGEKGLGGEKDQVSQAYNDGSQGGSRGCGKEQDRRVTRASVRGRG